MAKLLIKIADLVKECEDFYDIKVSYNNTVQMKHVKKTQEKSLCTEKIRVYRIRPQMWQKKDLIATFN